MGAGKGQLQTPPLVIRRLLWSLAALDFFVYPYSIYVHVCANVALLKSRFAMSNLVFVFDLRGR